jgi:hypothetical protein
MPALLAALFAAWAVLALSPGCDGGKPRPSELIPAPCVLTVHDASRTGGLTRRPGLIDPLTTRTTGADTSGSVDPSRLLHRPDAPPPRVGDVASCLFRDPTCRVVSFRVAPIPWSDSAAPLTRRLKQEDALLAGGRRGVRRKIIANGSF